MVRITRIADTLNEYERYVSILVKTNPAMNNPSSSVYSVYANVPVLPGESISKELCILRPEGIDMDYGVFIKLPTMAKA